MEMGWYQLPYLCKQLPLIHAVRGAVRPDSPQVQLPVRPVAAVMPVGMTAVPAESGCGSKGHDSDYRLRSLVNIKHIDSIRWLRTSCRFRVLCLLGGCCACLVEDHTSRMAYRSKQCAGLKGGCCTNLNVRALCLRTVPALLQHLEFDMRPRASVAFSRRAVVSG